MKIGLQNLFFFHCLQSQQNLVLNFWPWICSSMQVWTSMEFISKSGHLSPNSFPISDHDWKSKQREKAIYEGLRLSPPMSLKLLFSMCSKMIWNTDNLTPQSPLSEAKHIFLEVIPLSLWDTVLWPKLEINIKTPLLVRPQSSCTSFLYWDFWSSINNSKYCTFTRHSVLLDTKAQTKDNGKDKLNVFATF